MYGKFFKRLIDFTLSLIALIVLSPLLLILTIIGAIIMKGNPFFIQKRPGMINRKTGEERIISLIKFRTMTNAKDSQGNLLPDEKRLVPYGKFLRSTSLDELPSLVNIVCGQLSICGPRPLLGRYLPYYTEEERHRHDVRPGLTGWAQVNGRNFISWEETFEYDLFYIKNISLALDIKILLLTLKKVVLRADITYATQGTEGSSGKTVHDALDIERREKMSFEIGSTFWEYDLETTENKNSFWWQTKSVNKIFLKSGRNAIKALCRIVDSTNRVVLVPSYTCETVIEPFLDEGWHIHYYKIDKDLCINIDYLEKLVAETSPKMIFVHSYFGFSFNQGEIEALEKFSKQGIEIAEDMTQSLFSEQRLPFADYYIASFRKFLAIPDGGVLISRKSIPNLGIQECDNAISKIAFEAFDEKRRYFETLKSDIKDSFREKYETLKNLIGDNNKLREISDVSLKLILSCDKKNLSLKRTANYLYLLNGISNIQSVTPITKEISSGETPLYLPVYTNYRRELQSILAKNNIYCPVIWPRSNYISINDNDVSFMYEHMLCFPIDQRYDSNDMQKVIDLLKNYNIYMGD